MGQTPHTIQIQQGRGLKTILEQPTRNDDCLESPQTGLDILALLVLQRDRRQAFTQREVGRNLSARSSHRFDSGHQFARPLCPDDRARPFCAPAIGLDGCCMLGRHLVEIAHKHRGHARSIAAHHTLDRKPGQGQQRIQCLDGRIIPATDVTCSDSCQGNGVKPNCARFETRQVQKRHDAPDHGRKLEQAPFVEFDLGQWHVGRAKVDTSLSDALDTCRRAFGLVGKL